MCYSALFADAILHEFSNMKNQNLTKYYISAEYNFRLAHNSQNLAHVCQSMCHICPLL